MNSSALFDFRNASFYAENLFFYINWGLYNIKNPA